MKEIILNGKKVLYYDDIEDLPIERYHKFNKYNLISENIGSGLEDINVKLQRVSAYIKQNKNDMANMEIYNIQLGINFMLSETNVENLSFACLIHSIDKEKCNDLSDDGLKRTLGKIKNTTKKEIDSILQSSKKKIYSDLKFYFPERFKSGTSELSFKIKLIDKVNLYLNDIISDIEEFEKKLDEKNNIILTHNKPLILFGEKNEELAYEKRFADSSLLIKQELNLDTLGITTKRYFEAMEVVEKNIKQRSKMKNKGLSGRKQ